MWLDGRLLDLEEARVSPLDRGFLYGDGLFETLRTYRGQPFLLEEHLDRLAASAKDLELPLPPRATLREAVRDVVAANGLDAEDARVRLTVTRGAGAPGEVWPAEAGLPTVLVTAQPVRLPASLEEGVAAIVASQRVLAGAPPVKSTSFQAHVLAKAEARRAGAWEALLRNHRGHLAEGATSNLFLVDDAGALRTPPPDAGALPGLTRAVVLRLAASELGLAAREVPVEVDDLRRAREAFLSSSVAEVVPLVRLDGRALGDGAPGPVTRAVREAYRAEVRRRCAR